MADRVRALLAATVIAAAVPATAAAEDGARVATLQSISGPTPFAGDCGDPGPGEGIAGGEAEPHLTVNPADPDHLLATWQQDRYSIGGAARSDLTAVSFDGGRSWARSTIPDLSWCTITEEDARADTRPRASDPWAAIGPDGIAYHASTTVLVTDEEVDLDLPLAASADGGLTWAQPVLVGRDGGELMHEKPQVVADPASPGSAVATWARIIARDDLPRHSLLELDVHIGFSRTDDGGRTWSKPAVIPPDLPGVVEWPMDLAVVPRAGGDSAIVVLYATPPRSRPLTAVDSGPNLYFTVRSDDGGRTWSPPSPVGIATGVIPTGDVEQVRAVSSAMGVPRLASGPDGTLYAAWHDRTPVGLPTGGTVIVTARSDDLGATWKPQPAANLTHQAFLPAVAVAGDGTVGISFYDFRNDELGDDELTTDVWLRYSSDRGATWRELHLAGPFDARSGPIDGDGSRYMFGDYTGLVGLPDGFGALFTASSPLAVDGRSDVFFARVRR